MKNQDTDLILNTAYDRASCSQKSESNMTFQTSNTMFTRMKVVFREIDRIDIKRKYSLDIGCGTGIYTRELSIRSNRVLGMDLSYGMIKYANELSKDISNIDYIVADANHLPIKDNSMDLIVCVGVLQHFSKSKLSKIIQELNSVLSIKNGSLYAETLNSMSVFYLFRIIMEFVLKIFGRFKVDLDNTIKGIQWYRFNPYWIEQQFINAGMTGTCLYGVYIFPKPLGFLTTIFSQVEKLNRIFLPLNHSFLLRAEKRESEANEN